MTISNVSQFTLLLWKNWLLRKRRIPKTIFVLLIPSLFLLLLFLMRLFVEYRYVSESTVLDSFEASTLLPANLTLPASHSQTRWKLVYTPNTSPAATRMAKEMTQKLGMTLIGNKVSL